MDRHRAGCGEWGVYVGVGDIKPLELLLDLRVCNAGAASEQSAPNKNEGGTTIPAISIELVQDLSL